MMTLNERKELLHLAPALTAAALVHGWIKPAVAERIRMPKIEDREGQCMRRLRAERSGEDTGLLPERKRARRGTVISRSVTMPHETWAKIDELKGCQTRGAWIAELVERNA